MNRMHFTHFCFSFVNNSSAKKTPNGQNCSSSLYKCQPRNGMTISSVHVTGAFKSDRVCFVTMSVARGGWFWLLSFCLGSPSESEVFAVLYCIPFTVCWLTFAFSSLEKLSGFRNALSATILVALIETSCLLFSSHYEVNNFDTVYTFPK